MAYGTVIAASPVQAMNPRPDFRLPFPCGETWNLTSRDNHNPQDAKIDFYAVDDSTTQYSPVLASAAGHVTQAPEPTPNGEVEINHGNGWFSSYMHMSGITVRLGDYVGQGQVIGYVDKIGVIGYPPAPHLHYEQAYDFNGDNNGDFSNPTNERQIPVLEGRVTNMAQLGDHYATSTNSCAAGGRQSAVQYDFGLDQQLQILAARPGDSMLMQRWYDPKTAVWHLNSLGHRIVGEPAVTVFKGELHVIARRADNKLIDVYFSPRGGGWRFNVLPGEVSADPDVAFYGPNNNLHVAARGTNGLLYRWWTTPSGWSNPVNVDPGLQITGKPAIAGFHQGLYIVARAADNKMWSWLFGGGLSASGRRLQLEGAGADDPDLSGDPWGYTLHAIVRGTDNQIWYWDFPSHRPDWHIWTSPSLIGQNRSVAGAPAAAVYRGALHVVARGTDSTIYHWWRNGDGSWNREAPGGQMSGNPSAFKYKDMFHITGKNAGGGIKHIWFNGTWNQADRSLGDGANEPPNNGPPGTPPAGTNHTDLNSDGKSDLLTVYGNHEMHWYPGKGDGSFWSARFIDHAGFKLMAKGDLNGDSKADLLAVYEGSNAMYWYPGKGDGTFWSARYLSEANFRHMELADLNGDGNLDLLAVYTAGNAMHWYPGKGDGTFWSARPLDQANFKNLAVGDLNGDGKADLLAVYDGSNGMHWYPGKGDGTFWSPRYISQANFRHMELADLNGDGKRDLLAVYDGSNAMYWYPGKGDGTFWSARPLDQGNFKLMAL
ncbi:FG-GAP-like repeat-containing protein [Rhizohabitans arisaemae]|uniref:FG-GAP-like repeat-containing protein n=1 Tax=Rhizohabitans arisaemae TaxID=2720610 RepID=UPI0024B20F30|nr:FG-GAP-like repeat-containing protein [Rhizohabitans arisaemae]